MVHEDAICSAAPTYRQWRVPAVVPANLRLPAGFVPMMLRLTSQRVELELVQPTIVVGRHTLVDLCLPYEDISRRHCRFQFGRHWEVVDLGSLNGVLVNGSRVQKAPLHAGDLLQLGSLVFDVDLASVESSESNLVFRQIASLLQQSRRAS